MLFTQAEELVWHVCWLAHMRQDIKSVSVRSKLKEGLIQSVVSHKYMFYWELAHTFQKNNLKHFSTNCFKLNRDCFTAAITHIIIDYMGN